MAGKCTIRSKEEKSAIVKRNERKEALHLKLFICGASRRRSRFMI